MGWVARLALPGNMRPCAVAVLFLSLGGEQGTNKAFAAPRDLEWDCRHRRGGVHFNVLFGEEGGATLYPLALN